MLSITFYKRLIQTLFSISCLNIKLDDFVFKKQVVWVHEYYSTQHDLIKFSFVLLNEGESLRKYPVLDVRKVCRSGWVTEVIMRPPLISDVRGNNGSHLVSFWLDIMIIFLTAACDGLGLDFISFPLGHICEHHLALIAGNIMEVLWR